MRLPQMLDGGVAPHERLCRTKLEQHVGALLSRRRFGDCAAKVRNGALRSSPRGGQPCSFAKCRNNLRIGGRLNQEEVRGNPFRLGSRLGEKSRRPFMPNVSFKRCECLIDGRADQWVNEPQWRLWAQDIDPCESAGCVGGSP